MVYLQTTGEVPHAIAFAARYHPSFLKAYRAKWEAAFRGGLPKQMMPYLMLRHCAAMGLRDGMRQAALLGKAWGLRQEWVIKAVMQSGYYFGGIELLDLAHDALADVLDQWE